MIANCHRAYFARWVSRGFRGRNIDALISTNPSIIGPEGHQFIFYLTKSIFFHGEVIRDTGETGGGIRGIRSSVHS